MNLMLNKVKNQEMEHLEKFLNVKVKKIIQIMQLNILGLIIINKIFVMK